MSASALHSSAFTYSGDDDELPPPYELGDVSSQRASSGINVAIVRQAAAATITHTFIETARAAHSSAHSYAQSHAQSHAQNHHSNRATASTTDANPQCGVVIYALTFYYHYEAAAPKSLRKGFGVEPLKGNCIYSSPSDSDYILDSQGYPVRTWNGLEMPSKRDSNKISWHNGENLHKGKLQLLRKGREILLYSHEMLSLDVKVSAVMQSSTGAAKPWSRRNLTSEEFNADLSSHLQVFTLHLKTVNARRDHTLSSSSIATVCVAKKLQDRLAEIIFVGQSHRNNHAWTLSENGKTLEYLNEAEQPQARVHLSVQPACLEFVKSACSRMMNSDMKCSFVGCTFNIGMMFRCHTCYERAGRGEYDHYCEAHVDQLQDTSLGHNGHRIQFRKRIGEPFSDLTDQPKVLSIAALEQEMRLQDVVVGSLALVAAALQKPAAAVVPKANKNCKMSSANLDMTHLVKFFWCFPPLN